MNINPNPKSRPWDVRVVKPKMWENLEVPDRCPIKIYKFYQKRPSDFCNPDDLLYLATHTQQCAMTHEDEWFKRQPPQKKNQSNCYFKNVSRLNGSANVLLCVVFHFSNIYKHKNKSNAQTTFIYSAFALPGSSVDLKTK